jgi:hypothetical protein
MYTWNEIVVIKHRERDVQVWKNVKVYFKWGWNKTPFDINSFIIGYEKNPAELQLLKKNMVVIVFRN